LLALNHFTVPCSLLTALLFLSARLWLSTALSYLMPRVPSPSTEPRPSSSFTRRIAKRLTEQKKGRKCDLATALLPKGDTNKSNKRSTTLTRLAELRKDFFVYSLQRRILAVSAPGGCCVRSTGRDTTFATRTVPGRIRGRYFAE
jgi:hypothetical protein